MAIKVLPEAFAQDAERLARFEREAKMLASLNHPNIAPIYGLEQTDGDRGAGDGAGRGRRSPNASGRVRFPLTRRCPSPSRSPRRSKRRTSKASSTAI